MNSKHSRDAVSRRRFLAGLGSAGLFATTGCVPGGIAGVPDLVWGEHGMGPGRFVKPRAITIDDDDQLYIVDTTGRIQVFNTDGILLRSWRTPLTENGRPTGLAIEPVKPSDDRASRLLVADTHYYRMLSYSLSGELQQKKQIGGTAGHLPGEFAFVTDAVTDRHGCVYIGEYNASDRIQKFDPSGGFITQWGGTGHAKGKFLRPQSLVISGDVLWVCDSCNHRIQRFDIRFATPKLIDVWGGPGTENGQFYFPYDLAIASDETVLVIEYKNNRIQRFEPNGKWIASWGTAGVGPGMLNQPWGLVIDSKDRVHVLDSNNHRVQRIALPV